MLLAHVSSSESSVGAGSPRRVWVISRLRRVAASICTKSSALWTRMLRTCEIFCPCVSLAYPSSAPAASIPRVKLSQPKPDRSSVENCWHKLRRAVSSSKCQTGSVLIAALQFAGGVVFSASKISEGCRRSSSAGRLSASASLVKNWPDARFNQAMPSLPWRSCIASNRLSRFSSSRAESVSVPGVTMRTTLRSTGPLLVAGSPICSQIATDSPSFTSFAR